MKNLFTLLFILLKSSVFAQDFNEQFFYESRGNSWYGHTGVIGSMDDSLAYIQFSGPLMGDNAYFACRYHYKGDTLFLVELSVPIDLEKDVEYRIATPVSEYYKNLYKDSLHLGYQIYYEGTGGQPVYDSLFFLVNKKKYAHTGQCDSYCAVMKRPKKNKFKISVWNGSKFLDEFEIILKEEVTAVRMTKNIFSSSTGFGALDDNLAKIPNFLEIDGKNYVLITELLTRNHFYQFTVDP